MSEKPLIDYPLHVQAQCQQSDDDPRVWRLALFIGPLSSEDVAKALMEKLAPIIGEAIYGKVTH